MRKSFTGLTVKSADKGEVSAVFSTNNVVDKDGDVTLPGAIKDGAEVVISAYQHGSSIGGELPVGRGVIRATDDESILEGKFFLNTPQGRATFETVKQLGDLGEWSYSLHDVISERGELNGEPVNFLKSIRVKEVSPVLIGAGVNTRTLGVKGADTQASTGGVIPAEPVAGVDDLRKSHAWVNTLGDPESAGSYAFRHHKADGTLDLRELLEGVARLKTGSHSIPDADVPGVFEHLAEHLRDMDYEPAPLKTVTLLDELVATLAGVRDVRESAARVVALRAQKGRHLSTPNADALKWLISELRGVADELQAVHDTPSEALEREWLRFIRNTSTGETS